MSAVHDRESPWVSVNNVRSKQRSKRKRSNKAKLSTNANPAEPHQPTKERNQISHQNPNAAQQMQNPSLSVCCGNPSPDHKKACLHSWGFHYSTRSGLGTNNEWETCGSQVLLGCSNCRYGGPDYLRPLLREETDEIILHVRTNNIHDESPRSVAESIVNMVTRIQQDFPTTHLSISPLLPRSDNLEPNSSGSIENSNRELETKSITDMPSDQGLRMASKYQWPIYSRQWA